MARLKLQMMRRNKNVAAVELIYTQGKQIMKASGKKRKIFYKKLKSFLIVYNKKLFLAKEFQEILLKAFSTF